MRFNSDFIYALSAENFSLVDLKLFSGPMPTNANSFSGSLLANYAGQIPYGYYSFSTTATGWEILLDNENSDGFMEQALTVAGTVSVMELTVGGQFGNFKIYLSVGARGSGLDFEIASTDLSIGDKVRINKISFTVPLDH